ncbi:hypothetical protein Ancab_026007 [Ancistrocladus abbreviatus]
MWRHMRKCEGEGEIAVVGVAELGGSGSGGRRTGERTVQRQLALAAAKRIRMVRRSNREANYAYKYVVLRSRRRATMITWKKNSTSFGASRSSSCVEEVNCSSGSSSEDHMPASCCSSSNNGSSSQLMKDSFAILDPEGEDINADELERSMHLHSGERRETTPSSESLAAELSDDLDSSSTLSPSEANSRLRSTVHKMPPNSEIEEFFTAAEKDIQKRFIEKYNFDIVKDMPLEGRYEWVPVKP